MRKILSFAVLFLLVAPLISQNLNIAEHTALDGTGEMVSINSKSYFLADYRNNCDAAEACLACLNDSGRIVVKYYFGTTRSTRFGRLIKTKDKCLVFTGSYAGSSDIGPYDEFIMKMDTTGQVLFRTSFSSSNNDAATSITQHLDSSYYLTSRNAVLHFSKTGPLLPFTSPAVLRNTAIEALSNGNLLLNGEINNIKNNFVITATGSIVLQQLCLNKVIKYVERFNYILALDDIGVIEKYNSGLSVLATSTLAFNPSNYKITNFSVRNDSIFVTGMTVNTKNPFYAILDPNFNVYYQTTANYKGVQPTGISVTSRNAVHIVTTSFSKSSPFYTFSSIYRLNLTGAFHSVSDIGIIGFSNLNTRLLGDGSFGSFMMPYINLDVNVKNFGVDTVRSFYINYYAGIGGSSICYILLHKKVDTLLAPGSVITVATGSFYGQPFTNYQIGTFISERNLNMCLFTSVPNGHSDIEIDNDAFCDSVMFTITGIGESKHLETEIKIFPNPFNNGINISAEFEIKSVELISSLSEVIRKEQVNAKSYMLKEIILAPGVYFIKLETENGTLLKKIIRE